MIESKGNNGRYQVSRIIPQFYFNDINSGEMFSREVDRMKYEMLESVEKPDQNHDMIVRLQVEYVKK